MLSITEMAVIGVAALVLFGPEQLPKMARKVGTIVRDVQNTSATFIREMERAADEHELPQRLEPEEPASKLAQLDSEITG
ncbi:MAG: twin-arginine translocase TatA/TatE family subunit [Candidatus Eremiobacteraeota bacterium]|nr:twin-arginine translocase TatA/TatE family subunit [Candidatus Eremiobacteraeota bacterium]